MRVGGPKVRQLEGQTILDLFAERVPGKCPDEGGTVEVGGTKSFCIPWDCWTNCREVGRCVYERRHK
jgi:hypothetical protein